MSYGDLLKDPRWQKKRLEIFERDGWRCVWCKKENETLHIHHVDYQMGLKPWEYSNDQLLTLCEDCHHGEYENREYVENKLIDELKKLSVPYNNIEDLANAIMIYGKEKHPDSDWDEIMYFIQFRKYFIRPGWNTSIINYAENADKENKLIGFCLVDKDINHE